VVSGEDRGSGQDGDGGQLQQRRPERAVTPPDADLVSDPLDRHQYWEHFNHGLDTMCGVKIEDPDTRRGRRLVSEAATTAVTGGSKK
jgi:hypothetical protein